MRLLRDTMQQLVERLTMLQVQISQALYGAEIEAETSEKDPSELKYITPIDYAPVLSNIFPMRQLHIALLWLFRCGDMMPWRTVCLVLTIESRAQRTP